MVGKSSDLSEVARQILFAGQVNDFCRKLSGMKRNCIALLLIALAATTATTSDASDTNTEGSEWVNYAKLANGDLYFYDQSRVEESDTLRRVWNGIQYKTSLMGAFSFSSLLEIECSDRTEKTLQRTFYSDKNWENAAMQTDTSVSKNSKIEAGSTTERLADIVCEQ